MKKVVVFLVLVMSVVSFGGTVFDKDVLVEQVTDTTDNLMSFNFKTKARSDFNVATFTTNPSSNFSRCTWIFNKTDGIGVFLDETETMTSLYKITNFTIKAKTINGLVRTIIYGEMLSDAGNSYTFLINDYSDVLMMTGYNLSNVVIRRFYDLQ